MANGNSTKADTVIKTIKELGLPTVLILVFIWIGIQYWIGPQTELVKAITESNANQSELIKNMSTSTEAMVEALDSLKTGMMANKDELKKISTLTEQQVVEMRQFTTAVEGTHKEQCEALQKLLEPKQ